MESFKHKYMIPKKNNSKKLQNIERSTGKSLKEKPTQEQGHKQSRRNAKKQRLKHIQRELIHERMKKKVSVNNRENKINSQSGNKQLFANFAKGLYNVNNILAGSITSNKHNEESKIFKERILKDIQGSNQNNTVLDRFHTSKSTDFKQFLDRGERNADGFSRKRMLFAQQIHLQPFKINSSAMAILETLRNQAHHHSESNFINFRLANTESSLVHQNILLDSRESEIPQKDIEVSLEKPKSDFDNSEPWRKEIDNREIIIENVENHDLKISKPFEVKIEEQSRISKEDLSILETAENSNVVSSETFENGASSYESVPIHYNNKRFFIDPILEFKLSQS